MVSIEAIMNELQLGTHTVSVYLLLYRSLFLSTMLFNSQSWTNLSKKDINDLQVCQLRMLKKILGGARSTSNSFTFLELGVLPISYEIHKRQISFLHHFQHSSQQITNRLPPPVERSQCTQDQTRRDETWFWQKQNQESQNFILKFFIFLGCHWKTSEPLTGDSFMH